MRMNGSDLMRALVAASGMSANAVAKAANGSQPQLQRLMAGKVGESKTATLQPFADYFNVDVAAFRDPKLAAKIIRDRGLVVPPPPVPRAKRKRPQAVTVGAFPATTKDERELLANFRALTPTFKRLLLADSRKYLELHPSSKPVG